MLKGNSREREFRSTSELREKEGDQISENGD